MPTIARPFLSLFSALALCACGPLESSASGAVEFSLVTHYAVEGNAEIVQAFAGGEFLVHTNSDRETVDIVDLRDPEIPATVAALPMPGEPTSVGVSPDGRWAMAVVYTGKSKRGRNPKDPRLPGVLALLDLRDPGNPRTAAVIGIGHHPDSIAVAARGEMLYGIVAIENEPLIVEDGKVVDSDLPGQAGDISEAGAIQIIAINPVQPTHHSVTTVTLDEQLLADSQMLFPADPQPEYVALGKSRTGKLRAAISLQENNGIVLIEPFSGVIEGAFDLGAVADRPADLRDDGTVALEQVYPRDALALQALAGARCPDAITFTPDGNYLLSADEGELELTGGRGFSVWSLDGKPVWDDAGEIERRAAEQGLYPDERSNVRGIEVEGIAAARFGDASYAFALPDRGSFVAIYDITNPRLPRFHQIIETATGPESAVAIPARGLVVVAAERGNALTVLRATPVP